MQSRTRNRRVLAVFLSIAAIGVAAVALFVPPVDVNTVDSTLDEYSLVTSMDVQLKLSANGDLDSTEQIQVAFPIERRGIFRIFDTEDPQNPDIEHPVTDVAVQRDGAPEHWEWVDSAKGTQTARIGREDTPLPPGIYTYTIDHSTTDVVGGVADDPNRSIWWWDVIGSGWAMPMDRVRVTAELPAEPLSVECVRGVSSACNMAVDGRSVVITESNLAPREPGS